MNTLKIKLLFRFGGNGGRTILRSAAAAGKHHGRHQAKKYFHNRFPPDINPGRARITGPLLRQSINL